MAPDLPGLVQQIAHFENRLASDPGSRVFLPLADLYRRAGKLEDARRILERGLERHPGFVTARVGLGLVLSQLGEKRLAREQLGEVLGTDPDNLLARRLLARQAAEEGRWDEAAEHYERLLRLEPESAEVREGLRAARSAVAAKTPPAGAADPGPMTPRSVAATTEAMGLETPTLAELYLRQGHPAKARVIVERILAAEPDRQDAREVLARIEAGEGAAGRSPRKGGGDEGRPGPAAARDEEAAATPFPAARPAASAASTGRGEDLDRFRAWLDAASGQRGSPN